MPAHTGKQQHFMGLVHAYQMGELRSADLPKGVRSEVAKTAKTISKKASKEFAQSVEEQNDIDFSVLSFKEYIVAESALVEAFSQMSDEELEHLEEKWAEEVELNPNKRGMFKGKSKSDLESELAKLKKSGPHEQGSPEFTKEKELNFALRAKSGWKRT